MLKKLFLLANTINLINLFGLSILFQVLQQEWYFKKKVVAPLTPRSGYQQKSEIQWIRVIAWLQTRFCKKLQEQLPQHWVEKLQESFEKLNPLDLRHELNRLKLICTV